MAEIEAMVVQVPGEVQGARVVGWKCDHCEQTHLSLSLLVLSDDGAEPLVLSVQTNAAVARKLSELIPQELGSTRPPAPKAACRCQCRRHGRSGTMAFPTERLIPASELQEGDNLDIGLLGQNQVGLIRRIVHIGATLNVKPNDRCPRRWVCVEDVSWPLLIGVDDVVKVVEYA